jgi:hypothetical protein
VVNDSAKSVYRGRFSHVADRNETEGFMACITINAPPTATGFIYGLVVSKGTWGGTLSLPFSCLSLRTHQFCDETTLLVTFSKRFLGRAQTTSYKTKTRKNNGKRTADIASIQI